MLMTSIVEDAKDFAAVLELDDGPEIFWSDTRDGVVDYLLDLGYFRAEYGEWKHSCGEVGIIYMNRAGDCALAMTASTSAGKNLVLELYSGLLTGDHKA